MKVIIEWLAHFSSLSVVIPAVIYVAYLKQLPKQNHIIGGLLLLYGCLDLLAFLLFRTGSSTVLVFNAGYIFQFILISWFYYEVMYKKFRIRIFMSILSIFTISFCCVNFFGQSIFVFQTWMWSISALIFVAYSFMLFGYLQMTAPILDRNLYSLVIMNSAICFYFSFNFFLFIISDYVLNSPDKETGRMIWAFHNVNNIIKNIAFAFGILYTGRRFIHVTEKEMEMLKNM